MRILFIAVVVDWSVEMGCLSLNQRSRGWCLGNRYSFWIFPSLVPELPGRGPRALAPEGGCRAIGVDGERRGPLMARPRAPATPSG